MARAGNAGRRSGANIHRLATLRPLGLLSLGLLGGAGLAHAAPCDTRPAGVDYLTPPFTAEQLRGALTQGLAIDVRMRTAAGGDFTRRLSVLGAGPQAATLREETLESGLRALPDTTFEASWPALRDRACLPAGDATRERVTIDSAFGALAGWRYRYVRAPVTVELWFADAYPGIPMRYERRENELVVVRAWQTGRSDVTAMPTLDGSTPSTAE